MRSKIVNCFQNSFSKNNVAKFLFYIMLLVFVLIYSNTIIAEEIEELQGHLEQEVTRVYDEDDNFVFSTIMGVTVGDRYISQENNEYIVRKVEQDKAIAENLGKVDLLEGVSEKISVTPLAESQENKLIALYHTHNGESYSPGPESQEGKGEIHEIGNTLAQSLEKSGIKVIHSHNLHLPHDGAAYARSKATALALAKKRPDAIFDLHRDAVPRKSDYTTVVNGKQVAQIRFVVGRQNPNRKVNDQFARHLKAVSDKKFPGLIKDIFYGRGEYNQSISPHSLLMEFGTHTNSEDEVVKSATIIAESITSFLYGGAGNQPVSKGAENRSAWTTIAWILFIVITGIIAYLFINEGSWEGVKKRIKNFFGRELLDRFK